MPSKRTNNVLLWNEEKINQKLRNLFESSSVHLDELLKPYREAAAVLPYFEFHKLQANNGNRGGPPPTEFADECETALSEEHTPAWSLRTSVRRTSLAILLDENRIEEALSANERPSSPLHQLLETSLRFKRLEIINLSRKELCAALVVRSWLNGIIEPLPTVEDINKKIDQQALLEPLLSLVGEAFAGREDQLRRLSDYVGGKPTSSWKESIIRTFEQVFNIHQRPPLFVFGPGGIGKSTLLAKFILNHIDYPSNNRLPFAYLDFDRPVIDPADPGVLLLEIARQISIQLPESAGAFQSLTDEWKHSFLSQVSDNAMSDSPPEQITRQTNQFLTYAKYAIKDYTPLLIVLDTFEEVQFLSRSHAIGVFRLLDTLQQQLPTLRLVLAGRITPDLAEYQVTSLELTEFDKPAAKSFLRKHGVDAEKDAETLAENMRRSPLILKMVAELWQKGESSSRVRNSSWIDNIFGKTTEVQLYTRILEHIHNPEVRKLAHPGLILRKITPELILKVLAGPCDIDVPDISAAQTLFTNLGKEVTLVTFLDSYTLEHRHDVRAWMLKDINQVIGENLAREIHQLAINYYAHRKGDSNRAEELYHRLSLGVDRRILKSRWADRAAVLLPRPAILELPLEAQAYVAARIPIEIDLTAWSKADQSDWERYTERVVGQSFGNGDYQFGALALKQRTARLMNSRLIPLDIIAQAHMGDVEQAINNLNKVLPENLLQGDPQTLLSYTNAALTISELFPQNALTIITSKFAFQVLRRLEESEVPGRDLLFLAIRYFRNSQTWLQPEKSKIFQYLTKLLKSIGADAFQSSSALLQLWIKAGTPGLRLSEFSGKEWYALARAYLINFDFEDIQPLLSPSVGRMSGVKRLGTPNDQLTFLASALEKSSLGKTINPILFSILTKQPEFLAHLLRIQASPGSSSSATRSKKRKKK